MRIIFKMSTRNTQPQPDIERDILAVWLSLRHTAYDGESLANLLAQTLACQLYTPVICSWLLLEDGGCNITVTCLARSGGCRLPICPWSEVRWGAVNPAQTDPALVRLVRRWSVSLRRSSALSFMQWCCCADPYWAAALCLSSSPRAKGPSTKTSVRAKWK